MPGPRLVRTPAVVTNVPRCSLKPDVTQRANPSITLVSRSPLSDLWDLYRGRMTRAVSRANRRTVYRSSRTDGKVLGSVSRFDEPEPFVGLSFDRRVVDMMNRYHK